MKRAQTNPPLAAPLQPHVFRDDVKNVDPVKNLALYELKVVQRGGTPQSGKLPCAVLMPHINSAPLAQIDTTGTDSAKVSPKKVNQGFGSALLPVLILYITFLGPSNYNCL